MVNRGILRLFSVRGGPVLLLILLVELVDKSVTQRITNARVAQAAAAQQKPLLLFFLRGAVVRRFRSARCDAKLGERFAGLVLRGLLSRVADVVAARPTDDRAQQYEQEGEGQAR